jgi:hypothetical protein
MIHFGTRFARRGSPARAAPGPAVIRPVGEDTFTHVIMPIHLG